MIKVKALNDNKTLNYTKDKEYTARISQQCNSILFLKNDLKDQVVVNKYDFEYMYKFIKINEKEIKIGDKIYYHKINIKTLEMISSEFVIKNVNKNYVTLESYILKIKKRIKIEDLDKLNNSKEGENIKEIYTPIKDWEVSNID